MSPGAFVTLAAGLVAVFRPDMVARFWNGAREERLEQLRAGEEERYFEERRQLEAYPIRHRWTARILGAVVVLLGIGQMFL